MADLSPGTEFADTSPNNAVNAARLNGLVGNATILPGTIGEKAYASTVADGDALLLLQASSSQLRQCVFSTLGDYLKTYIDDTAAPISRIILQHGAPDAMYETPRYAWISVRSGRNVGNDGIQLWDDMASPPCWRYIQTQPLGVIVGYAAGGSPPWDGTGLGNVGGQLDGWAHCNGMNGTLDQTASETMDLKYIQFVGYPT